MKARDLINNWQKLIDKNRAVQEAEVVVSGGSINNSTVAGFILIDNPNNYKYSHIHLASSLAELIKICKIEYGMDDDTIIKNLIPICGFTTTDILEELE